MGNYTHRHHIDITQTLKYTIKCTIHRKPGFPCMEQPDNFPVFIKWEFLTKLVSFPGMEHYTEIYVYQTLRSRAITTIVRIFDYCELMISCKAYSFAYFVLVG
jgi:hypothetical protein